MIEIDVRTLNDRIGEEIAVSDWLEVTQARIDQFADATGDRQWIHVDPARAAAESPFKTTIAHGFLTLSLLSPLLRDSMQFSGLRMAINYGLNRVRFVSPVPVRRAHPRPDHGPRRRGGRRRVPGDVAGHHRTRAQRQARVRRRVDRSLLP